MKHHCTEHKTTLIDFRVLSNANYDSRGSGSRLHIKIALLNNKIRISTLVPKLSYVAMKSRNAICIKTIGDKIDP